MSLTEPLDRPATTLEVSALRQMEFWRRHFPYLTLEPMLNARSQSGNAQPRQPLERLGARMIEEGYFQDAAPALDVLAPKLARAVTDCMRLDIPPTFLFLFDEAWAAFHAVDPVIKAMLGGAYAILPDFWVWHVNPSEGQSGWTPHRDKGHWSLARDRSPLSLTVWIPLTEAAPHNGCMSILPANFDPVYGTPNDSQWKIDLPRIRALPVKPGEYLCWNQAVLHWGGATSRFSETGPRMSMALEFQRADISPFNEPLIRPFPTLLLDDRLKLVGKQILQYRHMYPLAARFEALAQQLLA